MEDKALEISLLSPRNTAFGTIQCVTFRTLQAFRAIRAIRTYLAVLDGVDETVFEFSLVTEEVGSDKIHHAVILHEIVLEGGAWGVCIYVCVHVCVCVCAKLMPSHTVSTYKIRRRTYKYTKPYRTHIPTHTHSHTYTYAYTYTHIYIY